MKILAFFQNLEAKACAYIQQEYETVIKPFVQKEIKAFTPLLEATEEDIVTYGVPIVLSFAQTALTGEARMAQAIPALMTALGNVGKTIAVADAQAGLQIIVNQVKGAVAKNEPAAVN